MPQNLERLRNAAAENVLKKIGKSIRSPFIKVGQLTSSDHQGLLAKLPHADTPEIQVMTPGANYGKFYFLADYSTVDGGDIIP